MTYQCNEAFRLYRDGELLSNTRMFNKTCELELGMIVAKRRGNYTCVVKWLAVSQVEHKYNSYNVTLY